MAASASRGRTAATAGAGVLTDMMQFTLRHTDTRTEARAGELATDHGVIQDLHFTGDFFSVVEPEVLAEKLRGVRLEEQSLRAALTDETVSRYFSGLENGELIELLLS